MNPLSCLSSRLWKDSTGLNQQCLKALAMQGSQEQCTGWTFVLTQSSCSYVLNIDVFVFLVSSVGNFISGTGDQSAW